MISSQIDCRLSGFLRKKVFLESWVFIIILVCYLCLCKKGETKNGDGNDKKYWS